MTPTQMQVLVAAPAEDCKGIIIRTTAVGAAATLLQRHRIEGVLSQIRCGTTLVHVARSANKACNA